MSIPHTRRPSTHRSGRGSAGEGGSCSVVSAGCSMRLRPPANQLCTCANAAPERFVAVGAHLLWGCASARALFERHLPSQYAKREIARPLVHQQSQGSHTLQSGSRFPLHHIQLTHSWAVSLISGYTLMPLLLRFRLLVHGSAYWLMLSDRVELRWSAPAVQGQCSAVGLEYEA